MEKETKKKKTTKNVKRESKTKELFHYDFIDTGFKTMHSQRVKRIHVFRQKTKSEEEIKISYQDVINYIRK